MKKHKFSYTDIEHHDDGSKTVHHGGTGDGSDVKYAASDTDDMCDQLCDHLDPEETESKLEDRGIDAEKLEELISPGIHETMADLLKG